MDSFKQKAGLPPLYMRPTTREKVFLQLLVYETAGGYTKSLTSNFLNLKAVARRLINNEPDPVLEGADVWEEPYHSPKPHNQWWMGGGKYTEKQKWWDDTEPTPIVEDKSTFTKQ